MDRLQQYQNTSTNSCYVEAGIDAANHNNLSFGVSKGDQAELLDDSINFNDGQASLT